MPDYSQRLDFEAALAVAIGRPFDAAQQQAEAGAVNWSLFGQQVETAAAVELERAFTAVYLFMLDTDIVSPIGAQISRTWSMQTAHRISQSLVVKSQVRLSTGAIPESVFSRARAAGISTTETTRLISAAETAARRTVAGGPQPLPDGPGRSQAPPLDVADGLSAIWWTERDGRVCNICRRLHRQPYGLWSDVAPFGPPAHPRCRCWLVYQSVRESHGGVWVPRAGLILPGFSTALFESVDVVRPLLFASA